MNDSIMRKDLKGTKIYRGGRISGKSIGIYKLIEGVYQGDINVIVKYENDKQALSIAKKYIGLIRNPNVRLKIKFIKSDDNSM